MPRSARRISKSKTYHIMIRGINQQNIFLQMMKVMKNSWIFILATVKRLGMKYMPIA